MEPLTTKQSDLIVKNVVAACKDINKLNGTGYKFLYLLPGFIAHYDIHGFKSAYTGAGLAKQLLGMGLPYTNFLPSDKDYAYYKSKQATFCKIIKAVHP